MKCAALRCIRRFCWSQNTVRLWPSQPSPRAHTHRGACVPSSSRWPHLPGTPGTGREGLGAPVPLAGLRRLPLPIVHVRLPPATGSNLHVDKSMICAQAEEDKVSGRLAGTLPVSPSPSLLWAVSPLFPWLRQRPPFSGPEIHPPLHTLSSPAVFNCHRGSRCRQGPAGISNGDLGWVQQGHRSSSGHREKQRSPQKVSQRLPRPRLPSSDEEVSGEGAEKPT